MNYQRSDGGILVPESGIRVGGVFDCELVRGGEIVDRWQDHNLVVNQGLNSLLDIMFRGAAQIGSWYLGIFEGNYTPVATVTAATISAASTECTAYAETSRPAYDEAAAANQSITNSASRATFTFNAAKTIYGAFLVSASAKGATTGTLFSAARFASAKQVEVDDQLLVTYTFNASSL